MPPIVLPITSRGLAVTDRLCWVVLGAAMVASAGVILYLNRGTTFFLDELVHVYNSPTLDLREVFEPVNGHLAITPKLVYKGVLEAVGTEYVVFRVLHALAVALSAGVFYTLVKRRIGALPALAPAVVLLFYGSAWAHVAIPVGLGIFVCVAAALGALLALERGDRLGDVAACALLCLAVATFTIGLAFVVGAAISVLLRADRWRRAWIFLVPLVLYAVWWLWALSYPGSSESETELSNVLEIPQWIVDSLAAVIAGLVGIDYDLPGGDIFGRLGWSRPLAVAALVVLALRIRRGNLPPSLWASLGIVLTYWSLGGLAFEPGLRGPESPRYMYPGAVMVLLVATDAARSVRFSRLGIAVLLAVAGFSVVINVGRLRDGAAEFRAYSSAAQAQFTAIDLARGRVDPGFNPTAAAPTVSPVGARAETYFASADRYGSLGYTQNELESQPEGVRSVADRILAPALRLRLPPVSGSARGCRTLAPGAAGGTIELELPPGGATLRARGARGMPVAVGRFAAPTATVGFLVPGQRTALRIPPGAPPGPWRASISDAASAQVCRLP